MKIVAILIALCVISRSVVASDILSTQRVKPTEGTITAIIEPVKVTGTITAGTVTVTNIKRIVTDGTDDLNINADGSINVISTTAPVTSVYRNWTATLASGVETELGSYTVTTGKTGYLRVLCGAASGAAKFILTVGGVAKGTYFVSPSNPTIAIPYEETLTAAAATIIAVRAVNYEASSMAVYTTVGLIEK